MKISKFAVLAVVGMAAPAFAATFPEVEGNDTKATANVVGLTADGDTITGAHTASAQLDYFRVRTPAATRAIYRHRLGLNNVTNLVGDIRGLNQAGTAEASVQASSSITNPPRFVQWYGFGKQEEIFYRTTGAITSYTATYSSQVIIPTDRGSYLPGSFTLSTQGQTTTDTELFLYDSDFNIVAINDDLQASPLVTQSAITAALAPGRYYLAVSTFNTANNLANPAPDSAFGSRMDFANSLVRNSTSSAFVDLDFTINGTAFTNSVAGAFDISWNTFEVIPTPGVVSLAGLVGLASLRRRRA